MRGRPEKEGQGFRALYDSLNDLAGKFMEIEKILVPLILAPQLDNAVYLLSVIRLMDIRHRTVLLEMKHVDMMIELSTNDENRLLLSRYAVSFAETIQKFEEGCLNCPEFLN